MVTVESIYGTEFLIISRVCKIVMNLTVLLRPMFDGQGGEWSMPFSLVSGCIKKT